MGKEAKPPHLTPSYSSYPQGGGGGGGRPPQIEEGNLTGAIGTQVNQLRICYRYLLQKCRCIVFLKIMGKRGLKLYLLVYALSFLSLPTRFVYGRVPVRHFLIGWVMVLQ